MIIEGLRTDPVLALLALLLAGHFAGDFLLQSRGMSARKTAVGPLLAHAGLVVLAHLVLVLPLLGPPVAAAVLAIGLAHAAIDWLKAPVVARSGETLSLLALDQAAHVLVVTGAWALTVDLVGPPTPWVPAEWLKVWVTAAVVGAAFAVNATGGSVVVRMVLGPLDRSHHDAASPDGAATGSPGAGHLIGVLERTITLILILAGQWAAMALLATAKSVARFDDLKDRQFAEYYLVGTLTSLLVAIAMGLALRGLGF